NFWLRAQGWLLAGLVDVASYMDNITYKDELCNQLIEALDGILKYQDKETKLFYNLIDKKDLEGNYLETSGSLLVAYSMVKGVNEGLLPEKYFYIGKEIFDYIYHNRFNENDGIYILSGTVLVSGLGPEDNKRRDGSVEYYLSEPVVDNEAKGVGPFIMTYTEIIRHK